MLILHQQQVKENIRIQGGYHEKQLPRSSESKLITTYSQGNIIFGWQTNNESQHFGKDVHLICDRDMDKSCFSLMLSQEQLTMTFTTDCIDL